MPTTYIGRMHYEMRASVCLSVRLFVACLDVQYKTTTERSRKPKIGMMEAHHQLTCEPI